MFPELDAETDEALGASIELHGVLVPVLKDQSGRIVDGYQRVRKAEALGLRYQVDFITVRDDDHFRELRGTLNTARRMLTPEQRRMVVADLRAREHSIRAIAGVVKVSKTTVERDLERLSHEGQLEEPKQVVGKDGRSRRPRRQPGMTTADLQQAQRDRLNGVEAVEDAALTAPAQPEKSRKAGSVMEEGSEFLEVGLGAWVSIGQ